QAQAGFAGAARAPVVENDHAEAARENVRELPPPAARQGKSHDQEKWRRGLVAQQLVVDRVPSARRERHFKSRVSVPDPAAAPRARKPSPVRAGASSRPRAEAGRRTTGPSRADAIRL